LGSIILSKYSGTLDKIKSGEIKEITPEIAKTSYLDATYQSVVWSLKSNCKQMPLVFQYCVYIYENEPLDENIKKQLRSILHVVQKEIKETTETP
jgi:uncharacterized protein YcfL